MTADEAKSRLEELKKEEATLNKIINEEEKKEKTRSLKPGNYYKIMDNGNCQSTYFYLPENFKYDDNTIIVPTAYTLFLSRNDYSADVSHPGYIRLPNDYYPVVLQQITEEDYNAAIQSIKDNFFK